MDEKYIGIKATIKGNGSATMEPPVPTICTPMPELSEEIKLGCYELLSNTADEKTQDINVGNWHGKIQVHGEDAPEIAKRIIDALSSPAPVVSARDSYALEKAKEWVLKTYPPSRYEQDSDIENLWNVLTSYGEKITSPKQEVSDMKKCSFYPQSKSAIAALMSRHCNEDAVYTDGYKFYCQKHKRYGGENLKPIKQEVK